MFHKHGNTMITNLHSAVLPTDLMLFADRTLLHHNVCVVYKAHTKFKNVIIVSEIKYFHSVLCPF